MLTDWLAGWLLEWCSVIEMGAWVRQVAASPVLYSAAAMQGRDVQADRGDAANK